MPILSIAFPHPRLIAVPADAIAHPSAFSSHPLNGTILSSSPLNPIALIAILLTISHHHISCILSSNLSDISVSSISLSSSSHHPAHRMSPSSRPTSDSPSSLPSIARFHIKILIPIPSASHLFILSCAFSVTISFSIPLRHILSAILLISILSDPFTLSHPPYQSIIHPLSHPLIHSSQSILSNAHPLSSIPLIFHSSSFIISSVSPSLHHHPTTISPFSIHLSSILSSLHLSIHPTS
ncbi:unnamed protein product [Pleuronectes platessa]|uniref:Uncharacterized protein n=1 Tax=Pleuronectes platessa TaxID=8262 RepID=A0A9N7TUR8_PLEPL|nr:unnamed protein product [Pleuronectes platessa]